MSISKTRCLFLRLDVYFLFLANNITKASPACITAENFDGSWRANHNGEDERPWSGGYVCDLASGHSWFRFSDEAGKNSHFC